MIAERRWAVVALGAYAVAATAALFAPISPGAAVAAVTDWVRAAGLSAVRLGWVEFASNIVLFLPLGFLLTVLSRRAWPGALAAVALSVTAELVQLALPSRVATPRDVVANTLGALIGTSLALLLSSWRRARRRSGAPDPDPSA